MENTAQDLTFADFDLAFEATAGLPGPDKKEEGFTETSGTAEGSGDAGTAPTEEELAAQAATDEAAKAAADEAAKVAATPPAPTVDEIAAKAAAKIAADAQAKADKEAADAAAKAAADKEAADAAARTGKETVSAEEQAVLDTLEANFPEVTAANAVLSRVIMAKVENMVEQRVAAVLAQLAPIAAVTQNVARNAHEQAILAAHPDAFTVLPQVEAWVETQPKVLKAAWNKVLDSGSTDEIIELYDVYKQAAGNVPASQGAAPDAAAAKAAAEAAAKEAKLKAQEGIKSRQTTQQSGIDEDDFEGAFNQAARA